MRAWSKVLAGLKKERILRQMGIKHDFTALLGLKSNYTLYHLALGTKTLHALWKSIVYKFMSRLLNVSHP